MQLSGKTQVSLTDSVGPRPAACCCEILAVAAGADVGTALVWFLHHRINAVIAGIFNGVFFGLEPKLDLRLRVAG